MSKRAQPCLAALVALGIIAGAPASAQTGAPARDLPAPPKADQTPDTPVPGKPPAAAKPGSSLGEELSQSNGVIKPPANMDPGIREPAPKTNSPMPIIRPPGSLGGRQDIQPK